MFPFFFLCHLEFAPLSQDRGHTEQFATISVEDCDYLEHTRGAHASAAMPYNLNNRNSMLAYQAQCGGPDYHLCPLFKRRQN